MGASPLSPLQSTRVGSLSCGTGAELVTGQEWDGLAARAGVQGCVTAAGQDGAQVGGVTAGTLGGRVQELGMGRTWSCWGQVGT